MSRISGGRIIAKMLKEEGVRTVFGIVDGTYLGLIAGLRAEGIDLITPRHETTAAHMAGAYARVTGQLGVCIASNGPGVANVLPGVAVESAEGNRVLLITSSRRTGIGYPDRGGTYQYFNQVGVMKPMSKWSGSAPSFDRIPEMFRRALRKSFIGRPGVVHFDLPENLFNGKTDEPALWAEKNYRSAPPFPDPELVARAAEILTDAQQPIIHAGSGIIHAGAYAELREVAEILESPVTTSWAARGVLTETSNLAVPMIHVALNHKVRRDADVVLALGTRFGETDWWGKAPYWRRPSEQRTIQVDIDEENIGMNKPVELGIAADVKVFLAHLRDELRGRENRIDREKRRRFADRVQKLRGEDRKKLDKLAEKGGRDSGAINPGRAAALCRDFFKEDAIVVFDGGNTAVWGNFFHEVRVPGTVLSTFKMGMLGAGPGQALGAAAAFRDRQVYCVLGDGAMGFHPQEVETAVRNKLKVVFIVFCDRQWGMVKMTQQFAFRPIKTLIKKSLDPGETINTDLGEIRFDLLAESMGAFGARAGSAEELRQALEAAQAAAGPAVIHVDVDPVQHMWAPGLMHFKDMHLEPKGR